MRRVVVLLCVFGLAAAVTYLRSGPSGERSRFEVERDAPASTMPPAQSRDTQPQRVDLPEVASSLSSVRDRLETAVRDNDMGGDACEELIAEIASLLRAHPELEDDVLGLFEESLHTGRDLASELLASAMGRVRYPHSLSVLMMAVDQLLDGGARASTRARRLVTALLQSTSRRTGVTTYVRFSRFDTSAVSEPDVRRWALERLERLSRNAAAPQTQGVLEALTLGLARGEIGAGDAQAIWRSISAVPDPTARGNLFEATHLSRSVELRRFLWTRVQEREWASVYELRMTLSALVKMADGVTLERLAPLLRPGVDSETTNAILECLVQSPPPPPGNAAGLLAESVVRIAFDTSECWGVRTRQLAARALVRYVSEFDLVAGITSASLRRMANAELPLAVLSPLAAIGAHVLPGDLAMFERALLSETLPAEIRAALLRSFLEDNVRMGDEVRRECLAGLAKRHPTEMRVLLPEDTARRMLIGIVVDTRGRPAPNLEVRLSRNGTLRSATMTDSNGAFSFENLLSGTYDLQAAGPDGSVGHLVGVSPGLGLNTIVLDK